MSDATDDDSPTGGDELNEYEMYGNTHATRRRIQERKQKKRINMK